MRVSIGSVLFSVVTIVSILGCGDLAGVGGTVVATYGYDCEQYGDVCPDESPYDGAFEFVVMPYDEAYSVTLEVTFKDAANGDDLVQTIELYPTYGSDGLEEFWTWSPSAPPTGYVEISGTVNLDGGASVPLFCSQSPVADWAAFNNLYEVQANDYYSSSTGCYAKVDLDRIID